LSWHLGGLSQGTCTTKALTVEALLALPVMEFWVQISSKFLSISFHSLRLTCWNFLTYLFELVKAEGCPTLVFSSKAKLTSLVIHLDAWNISLHAKHLFLLLDHEGPKGLCVILTSSVACRCYKLLMYYARPVKVS
jgi:hypothetical protein